MIERLDDRFDRAVELLFACKGRVVVTGMGKSGLIGRKISATFASTGTPSLFLHAAEAMHGDMGMLVGDDVIVAISYGGETEELVELLETTKRLGIRVITLTANPRSSLAIASDVVLDIAVKEEACSLNLAPTASTAATLAMGDSLAISVYERRGFKEEDFAALHPGGRLGKKLRRVESLMHSGNDLPSVEGSARMPDVIYEMSRKGLGLTAVVDGGGKRWDHNRRRPAAADAAKEKRYARPDGRRMHVEKSRNNSPHRTGRSSSADHGGTQDYFGAGG